MFNMGWPEIVVVGGVALLLFGAKRLPEAARSVGRSFLAFKQGLKEGERAAKDADDATKEEKTKQA